MHLPPRFSKTAKERAHLIISRAQHVSIWVSEPLGAPDIFWDWKAVRMPVVYGWWRVESIGRSLGGKGPGWKNTPRISDVKRRKKTEFYPVKRENRTWYSSTCLPHLTLRSSLNQEYPSFPFFSVAPTCPWMKGSWSEGGNTADSLPWALGWSPLCDPDLQLIF